MRPFTLILLTFSVLNIAACSQAQQISGGNNTLHKNHQLKACPDSPNCINTEYADKTSQYVPPFVYDEKKSEQIMAMAKQKVVAMGGTIIDEEKNYLSATFTSMIFRFVDDFEIRNDKKSHTLHVRSASRSGYSDFGVNKRRVEAFLKQLKGM